MIGLILSVVLGIMSVYIVVQSRKRKKIPDNFWHINGITTLDHNAIIAQEQKPILSMTEKLVKIYNAYKADGLRHIAHIQQHKRPMYTAIDPDIIRCILVEDFDHFINRGLEYDQVNDPLTSAHLLTSDDEHWQQWRIQLNTHTFTTGKMRTMLPTIIECSKSMEEILEKHSIDQTPVDIKEVLACYTKEMIGTCGFSIIEGNCHENSIAEFRGIKRKKFISKVSKVYQPKIEDITKLIVDLPKNSVEYRQKENIYRSDLMHLLRQIQNHGANKSDKPITEFTEQAFILHLAGLQTSSKLMTMACYELATHTQVQETLREEILNVISKHGGLTYDAVYEMSYLDKVLNETMRLHPPLPQLFRTVTKNYLIPGTDIVLEQETDVSIDICAIHRDPEYYPNPDVFDPENFNMEKIGSRPAFTFLPFGDGPRHCIGMRFAKLQSKIGLITLLRHSKITLNEKTEYPMRYNSMVEANGELYLDLQRIS